MAKLHVTDFFIYRWRYPIGYGLTIVVLAALLLFAGLFVPGGLTNAEMNSVALSAATKATHIVDGTIVNLPYYLLQHVSLSLLGISTLSIKLPSLLLALLAAIGMFLLLRQWFSRNVAVLAAAITITSGQYLIVAQSGTPSIVYIFFSVWLLLTATMITRAKTHVFLWKAAFFILAALSLYTPLSLYALVAIALIGVIHPHIRHILKHLNKLKLLAAVLLSLIIISPLILTLVAHPKIGLTLLGIPKGMPDIGANAGQLFTQYFGFMLPSSSVFMTPIFSLGAMILIVLGFVDMFRSKYTARSYTIMAWLLFLLPVILTNPQYTTVMFVPLLLLLAMGLQALIFYWYHLFPRNPYARIAGLIPLVVLVGGLVLSGVERYTYGYHYSPDTATYFSHDLRILDSSLPSAHTPVAIVVSSTEKPFYDVVARYHKGVTISELLPAKPTETTYVTHDAHTGSQPIAQTILTDADSQDANRFYIYKNGA